MNIRKPSQAAHFANARCSAFAWMHWLKVLLLFALPLALVSGTLRAITVSNIIAEYHNSLLDHCFLAILPSEIAAVDRGKAGPGWRRTGGLLSYIFQWQHGLVLIL